MSLLRTERFWEDSVAFEESCRRKAQDEWSLDGLRHKSSKIAEGELRSLLSDDLSFLNHANILNSWNCRFSGMKVFKPQHGPCSFLDKPMILLTYVVEIFDFSDLNFLFFRDIFVKRIKSCLVTSAFINGDLIGSSILLEGLSEEGFCSHGISFCS